MVKIKNLGGIWRIMATWVASARNPLPEEEIQKEHSFSPQSRQLSNDKDSDSVAAPPTKVDTALSLFNLSHSDISANAELLRAQC